MVALPKGREAAAICETNDVRSRVGAMGRARANTPTTKTQSPTPQRTRSPRRDPRRQGPRMSDLYCDLDAERTVLGAVLIENGAMNVLADMLTPKHFSDQRHQGIFDAMLALYARSQPIDTVTLKTEMAASWDGQYIGTALDGVPRITSPDTWARILIDKARRRAARLFAQRFLGELEDRS